MSRPIIFPELPAGFTWGKSYGDRWYVMRQGTEVVSGRSYEWASRRQRRLDQRKIDETARAINLLAECNLKVIEYREPEPAYGDYRGTLVYDQTFAAKPFLVTVEKRSYNVYGGGYATWEPPEEGDAFKVSYDFATLAQATAFLGKIAAEKFHRLATAKLSEKNRQVLL